MDAAQLPPDAAAHLQSAIHTAHLQVRTIEDAYMDTPVGDSAAVKGDKPSPVAIGLAMKLLMEQPDDIRINLLPVQVTKIREAKRDALVAANAIGVLLLIMVLVSEGPVWLADRVNRSIAIKRQLVVKKDIDQMLGQRRQLDAQTKAMSSRLDSIARISASRRDVNWVEVLASIGAATPRSVCITEMVSDEGSKITIRGLAVSNEAVSKFISLLEKSRNISSVALLETSEQNGQRGLITYQLSCKLVVRSGKSGNVS